MRTLISYSGFSTLPPSILLGRRTGRQRGGEGCCVEGYYTRKASALSLSSFQLKTAVSNTHIHMHVHMHTCVHSRTHKTESKTGKVLGNDLVK